MWFHHIDAHAKHSSTFQVDFFHGTGGELILRRGPVYENKGKSNVSLVNKFWKQDEEEFSPLDHQRDDFTILTQVWTTGTMSFSFIITLNLSLHIMLPMICFPRDFVDIFLSRGSDLSIS